MVRIGMVGCGFISHYHIRGIMQTEFCECVAVTSELNRHEFAQQYHIDQEFHSYDEMINSGNIDAVILSVPNYLHYGYSMKALQVGIHVLVEKPMAITLEEAEEMKEAAEKNSSVLMVGHMWRFDREIRYLADIVRSGVLGTIFKTKGYGIHVNWGPGGWFVSKKSAGGGSLVDMGIHAIDTTRFLIGDPLPKQVFADVGTYISDCEVDDTATLMIRWDNGVVSIIESGWHHPHMDGPESSVAVYGSEGYVTLFPTRVKYSLSGRKGLFIPDFPKREEQCDQHMYTNQICEFVRAILQSDIPMPGASEGIVNVRICEAAYQSSFNKTVVDLIN